MTLAPLREPSTPERRTAPRRVSQRTLAIGGTVAAGLLAVHWYAWTQTEFSLTALAEGWQGIWHFLFGRDQTYPNGHHVTTEGAFPIDTSWGETIRPGIGYCLLTVCIGLMGTTLSIPASLVFAVLGSRTTNRFPPLFWLARAVMSVLRAVPETVYALMFIAAVGFGAFPGVIALAIHNVAVMGKLWSEAMDEADQGPVEALRSAGASSYQTAVHAVLPTVMPSLLGLLLYRFDTNVRSSVILGTVGAGGIGFYIKQSVSGFRFDTMMTYVCQVVVLVILIDLLSVWLRKRLALT
ncbi:phosphonate ABC transporter, permease protein PhnE [Nocardioides daeguensis]|uniref:ABC transmembrane type-1 domain-containing protein n=1 Tax=Nocardioides daeguensis TaxID=908359 RepID=A0ABP6US24_9ACTN|nr:phosphonate ABC transporter, permease protein PhnE [Nocardioides daeguensis]